MNIRLLVDDLDVMEVDPIDTPFEDEPVHDWEDEDSPIIDDETPTKEFEWDDYYIDEFPEEMDILIVENTSYYEE